MIVAAEQNRRPIAEEKASTWARVAAGGTRSEQVGFARSRVRRREFRNRPREKGELWSGRIGNFIYDLGFSPILFTETLNRQKPPRLRTSTAVAVAAATGASPSHKHPKCPCARHGERCSTDQLAA